MEKIICKKCGSVDNYSTELKANNNVATCNNCGSFIKNISYEVPKFYVGKYKDKPVSEIEDISYLKWALREMRLTKGMRDAIERQISSFENLAR